MPGNFIETLGLVIGLVGVINSFLIASVLLLQHKSGMYRAAYPLAAILFLMGTVSAMVIAEHAGWLPFHWVLQAAEITLTLIIASLVLVYINTVLNRALPTFWVYLPTIAFAFGAIALQSRIFSYIGYGHVVLVHVFFLGLGYLALRNWKRARTRNPGELETVKHVGLMLSLLLTIYMAEAVRTAFPGSPYLENIVPLTSSVAILLLTIIALNQSRVLTGLSLSTTEKVQQTSPIFDQLDARVIEQELFLNPKICLDDLAELMGVGAKEISRLVNKCSGQSFPDYINAYRVKHAEQMLLDSKEAKTSVEAIGLLSGFGTRSTFYNGFQKLHGESPAQYRKNHTG